ncbi:MAG: glutamine--scyllo-inositol aminotransferase [Thermoprotei archaeon]|nr:MAG: glutamine--scyllo-inositol aminotransferase [Thermoprotei archaeon]
MAGTGLAGNHKALLGELLPVEKPARYGGRPVRTKPLPTVNDSSGRAIGVEEERLVLEVLRSGRLFRFVGDKVAALEREFAELMGVKYAVACSSGTAAIHAALAAVGVSPGDDVVTAPITDMGTVAPILFQGAIPIFADIDENTYTVDPREVERCITEHTAAIVPVHLFGFPADMDPIMEAAEARGVAVVEDCAQAYLAEYRGRLVGTIGHLGCFSLQQSKHMTAGEGGLVVTNDPDLAQRAALFTDKGWARWASIHGLEPREYVMLGLNYRMTELQGAVALAQLSKLRWVVERRRELAERLTRRLEGLDYVKPLPRVKGVKPSYWQYPIRVDVDALGVSLREFAEALRAEGIPCSAGYTGIPIYLTRPLREGRIFAKIGFPLSDNPFYGRSVKYREGLCPRAEDALRHLLVIPWNEFYTPEDVDDIAEALEKLVRYYASTRG